jgi:VanZ family protein
MRRLAQLLFVVATILCLAGVTVLSLVEAVRAYPGGSDKLAHGSAYAVLAFLFYWSLGNRWSWWKRLLFVAVACTLYGVAIEIVQSFVGRDREIADGIADAIGAVTGGGAAALIQLVPGFHPPGAPPGTPPRSR